ncbi:hypothetical protein ACIRL2_30025 [Embleya sp. NPDC127516]|uniref:hypothetical protein n=1 Tax=Embleya sp. NPDC127516 TaxID=3363990 RepID=UPI00380F5A4D
MTNVNPDECEPKTGADGPDSRSTPTRADRLDDDYRAYPMGRAAALIGADARLWVFDASENLSCSW